MPGVRRRGDPIVDTDPPAAKHVALDGSNASSASSVPVAQAVPVVTGVVTPATAATPVDVVAPDAAAAQVADAAAQVAELERKKKELEETNARLNKQTEELLKKGGDIMTMNVRSKRSGKPRKDGLRSLETATVTGEIIAVAYSGAIPEGAEKARLVYGPWTALADGGETVPDKGRLFKVRITSIGKELSKTFFNFIRVKRGEEYTNIDEYPEFTLNAGDVITIMGNKNTAIPDSISHNLYGGIKIIDLCPSHSFDAAAHGEYVPGKEFKTFFNFQSLMPIPSVAKLKLYPYIDLLKNSGSKPFMHPDILSGGYIMVPLKKATPEEVNAPGVHLLGMSLDRSYDFATKIQLKGPKDSQGKPTSIDRNVPHINALSADILIRTEDTITRVLASISGRGSSFPLGLEHPTDYQTVCTELFTESKTDGFMLCRMDEKASEATIFATEADATGRFHGSVALELETSFINYRQLLKNQGIEITKDLAKAFVTSSNPLYTSTSVHTHFDGLFVTSKKDLALRSNHAHEMANADVRTGVAFKNIPRHMDNHMHALGNESLEDREAYLTDPASVFVMIPGPAMRIRETYKPLPKKVLDVADMTEFMSPVEKEDEITELTKPYGVIYVTKRWFLEGKESA